MKSFLLSILILICASCSRKNYSYAFYYSGYSETLNINGKVIPITPFIEDRGVIETYRDSIVINNDRAFYIYDTRKEFLTHNQSWIGENKLHRYVYLKRLFIQSFPIENPKIKRYYTVTDVKKYKDEK